MKACLLGVVLLTLGACVHSPVVQTAPAPEGPGAVVEVERIELLPCVWVVYKPSLRLFFGCRQGRDS